MKVLSARLLDAQARPHPRHTGNPPRSRSSSAKTHLPSATQPYPRENPPETSHHKTPDLTSDRLLG